MDSLEILDRAGDGFSTTLARVAQSQWAAPTGNDGQTVRQLVDHVIGGDRMAATILGGGSRAEGLAQFAKSSADVDVVLAFQDSRAELAAAFAAPGALVRTVAHPSMEMPGAQLLGFRITEYALHGWDLARAIGADDRIDEAVLGLLWGLLEPLAPMLDATGMFGTGPRGTLPVDAPLQDRVLELSGRRP